MKNSSILDIVILLNFHLHEPNLFQLSTVTDYERITIFTKKTKTIMNKKLLSIVAIFAGLGTAIAQPTLTSADEAAVGANLNYYLGDTTNFSMMGSTNGAGVTWNWSTLMIDVNINQRTGDVNDATSDPVYGPLGSMSNFVIQDFLNTFSNYDGTVKHSQGFKYTTAGSELATVEYDTASYNMLEYPFDYSNMINNSISGAVTLNIGTIVSTPNATGMGTVEYDAYGTLMLPDTTFMNVARIYTRDSINAPFGGFVGDVDFVVDKYEYFDPSSSLDIPIFIVSKVRIYTGGALPQFDPIVSIYSAVALAPNTLGTEEVSLIESSIEMYPNPSTDNFTLRFNADKSALGEVKLMDITGKTVRVIAQGFAQGLNVFNVNTSSLTKGIYFVNVSNDKGTTTKKLIIQ